MEPNVTERLAALEGKMDAVLASSRKIETYFKWSLIAGVLVFVLPLIGVLFAAPAFLHNYSSTLQTLTQ